MRDSDDEISKRYDNDEVQAAPVNRPLCRACHGYIYAAQQKCPKATGFCEPLEAAPVELVVRRGNTWTLTLKLEDSADLAGYIADPNDGWPLIEDEGVMLEAVRRHFRGSHGSIALPNGGRVNVVDLELSPPEEDQFLTERTFRNQVTAEREAAILRTEMPQDARAALGMVLSAWEYLWRVHSDDRGRHARSELQEAAYQIREDSYEIGDAAGIHRDEAEDLEQQAAIKWAARERLGMLDQKEATQ
jgi:hypothetical protein